MRVAGEAIARQSGIENGDLAAGTAELQGGGEAGKAAADDDDVIHGDGLRVVDGGEWAGPGAQYRPAILAEACRSAASTRSSMGPFVRKSCAERWRRLGRRLRGA